MSTSSYIKLKNGKSKAPKSHDPYGDTYPYIRDHLDKVARRLKVESPLNFEYEDPEFYAEMSGEDALPEMAKRLIKQKEWHDASFGLKTFTALLNYFRSNPTVAIGRVERSALLYELEAFQLLLERASEKGDVFRIE